jgi:type I restriction enzyme M protein
MKTYNCGFCQKEFKQKNDYLRHRNRKTPCIRMDNLRDIAMRKQQNNSNMSTLKAFYSKCFNILRDNEHLTGDKALRNLSYLLILKLLEPKLNEINFRCYDDYNFDIEDDEEIEELFKFTRFSYLGESKEVDIQSQLNAVWDQILSQHSKTKEIFIRKKGFDIKRKETYKKLIKEISKINFSDIEQDIQGEAYEDILKDTMTGKVLGQFFTPPILKKICVDLVKPKINSDGTIETIFDLAMGTGGFLLTSIKYLEKEAKSKNIKLDWDFISNKGLGGIEAEPDTFQLAKSNMLISTGQLCDNIHLGDSIRNTIEEKYDIVLANPPYGIKGLNYLGIENKNRDEYLPIKSNSAVPLFIQAIVYILKLKGRCAVILPNGQELDGGNKDLVATREYLMKTCDLKEVICLPAGVFTHTSIRTCIFYFVKKKECNSVLETKISCSGKTGKETKRTYKFSKSHSTKSVKFYECNPHTEFKELKADVPIEKIADNSYSLNYNDYLEDEDEKYEDTEELKWVRLGDVFNCKMGKFMSNDMKNSGNIPFYSCISNNPAGYHDTHSFDEKEYLLLICAGGSQKNMIGDNVGLGKCYYVNNKTACRSGVCSLILKKNIKLNINLKFISYYLNIFRIETNKKAKFVTNLGTINITSVKSIKIPIPPLEKQQEIVSFCESNDRKIKELEEEIEFNKKLSSQILSSIFKSSETKEDSDQESDEDSSSDEESDEESDEDSSSDEE